MPAAPDSLRGIIHCHSKYSFDSMVSIRTYLRVAWRHKLDFIILTDHNTIEGSAALRKAAARQMPQLQVPLAAEYLTECGDVIAAFLQSEIKARTLDELVGEARAQGALLLFPHPYVSHKEIPRLAETCDLIEVFNSRAPLRQNQKAAELAASANKQTYAGCDAHLAPSLGRAVIQLENRGDLKKSMLEGNRSWTESATPRWEIAASQLIKAWKRREPSLAWSLVRRGMWHIRARMAG
jgi:predicted metal-dependent phosphoesterase TrpH